MPAVISLEDNLVIIRLDSRYHEKSVDVPITKKK